MELKSRDKYLSEYYFTNDIIIFIIERFILLKYLTKYLSELFKYKLSNNRTCWIIKDHPKIELLTNSCNLKWMAMIKNNMRLGNPSMTRESKRKIGLFTLIKIFHTFNLVLFKIFLSKILQIQNWISYVVLPLVFLKNNVKSSIALNLKVIAHLKKIKIRINNHLKARYSWKMTQNYIIRPKYRTVLIFLNLKLSRLK